MAKTGLWWDMSSCEFPSYFPPSLALHVAPSLLHKFALHNSNGCVTINAYSYKQNGELQNTLKKAGFKLQILPSGSEKKKIEKTMMGDVTLWITKNRPPANIIMLLGSSNMNKALQGLRDKGYKIFICNFNFSETYKEMLEVCDKHISWSHFLSLLLNEYEILRRFVQNGNCNIPLSSFADSTYKNSSFMESKIPRRDHVRPGFSSKNKYSNKTLGLEEFKAWLVETVGCEKYRDEGYDISGIPQDFLNSTGMRLQLSLLGCSKLIELVQLCNDVVTLVQLRHGYNVVFPRPQEHINSVSKKGGVKATMLQFHGFICRMMLLGDFSKCLLLCALAEKFKERSALLLDYKDLGHAKLSDLVATCSVVAIQSDGLGQSLVILSAEGKMYIKQIRKNGKDTKPIALKTNTGKQKSTLKTNTGNQKSTTLKTNTANLVSVNSDTKEKPFLSEYTEGGSGSAKLPSYVKLPCTEEKIPVSFNISPSKWVIRQPANVVKDAATSKVSSAKSTAQKSGNVVKDVATSLVTSTESIAHQSGNFAGENTIVNATSTGLPTKEKSCIPATSSPREQISCFPSECPYPNRMDNNNPYVRHVNDDVKIDVNIDNGEEETYEKLQRGKSEKDKGNAGWGKCCLNFAIRCLKGIAGWAKCCLNFAIQCLKRLFRSLLNCVVLYKKIIGKGKGC